MPRICKILVVACALVSCARTPDPPFAPKPLAVAEWLFIDAETMQPIEGAFVNFAWRGESDARGMTTCKHGVLGRSDKDGWFRSVATDPTWYADGTPAIFVPGYEYFDFQYGYPDSDHITTYFDQDRHRQFGKFPAFEARMLAKGYTYFPEGLRVHNLDRESWMKVMPSSGFHDRVLDHGNHRRYFIKYTSYPDVVGHSSFQFVGKVCGDKGATNDVNPELVTLSDHLRGFHSTKYFCDPAWNSIQYGIGYDVWPWVASAEWLLPQDQAREILSNALPEYYRLQQDQKRNLTADERTRLCALVQTYLPKGENL